MSAERLHVGISTCPNDTFAFHGLLSGEVELPGLALDFELCDVEELNRRLLAGEFDLAKGSFHAALLLAGEVGVLPVGAALGHGVGPVVLAREPGRAPGGRFPERPGSRARVLAPGEHTTATLLWKLFHPGEGELEQVVFSEIMPRLAAGEADFGVCIHEGRFTWRERGLALVEDLGERWERASGCPLPLGGILARRRLGPERLARFVTGLRASLRSAEGGRERALATMRRWSQEASDEVLWAHVELYVNEWTRELGPRGEEALAELAARARAAGLVAPDARPLEVLGASEPVVERRSTPSRGEPVERLFRLSQEEPVERLFHVTPPEPWRAFEAAGDERFAPDSLAREGFAHLSYERQLAGTLATHFAGHGRVLLLELDPRALGSALRHERSRGGEPFPHLYRAIERAEVRAVLPLERGPAGWPAVPARHSAGDPS